MEEYINHHTDLDFSIVEDDIWNLQTSDILLRSINKRLQNRYIIKCPHCFIGQFTLNKKPDNINLPFLCRYVKCQKLFLI